MKRRTFDGSQDSEPQQSGQDRSFLCRMPGCRCRWAVDINHGKVCSHHDAVLTRSNGTRPPEHRPVSPGMPAIPFHAAVPHWSEVQSDDQA